MKLRARLVVAGLIAIFPFCLATAQTPDVPKKNCTSPIVKHQEEPLPSRFLRSDGLAVLDVLINDKGRVTEANLQNSSGDDEFDGNALDAVKHWTFKPSLCDGKPSSMQIRVQVKVARR